MRNFSHTLLIDYNDKIRDYNAKDELWRESVAHQIVLETRLTECQNNLEECTKLISGVKKSNY